MESLLHARSNIVQATDLISELRNQPNVSNILAVTLNSIRSNLLNAQRDINQAINAPSTSLPPMPSVFRYQRQPGICISDQKAKPKE